MFKLPLSLFWFGGFIPILGFHKLIKFGLRMGWNSFRTHGKDDIPLKFVGPKKWSNRQEWILKNKSLKKLHNFHKVD